MIIDPITGNCIHGKNPDLDKCDICERIGTSIKKKIEDGESKGNPKFEMPDNTGNFKNVKTPA